MDQKLIEEVEALSIEAVKDPNNIDLFFEKCNEADDMETMTRIIYLLHGLFKIKTIRSKALTSAMWVKFINKNRKLMLNVPYEDRERESDAILDRLGIN